MKYILTLFCLVSFVAYGQEPAYTPMRLNYQFRGIKVDSLFLIPSFIDTTAANNSTMKNVAGAMIRTGNDFYMRNATTNAWLQNVNVGTGASPSIQFVDSVWRVVGKDSIFWRKGGTTNRIKDSTGVPYAGDSPDRIDGTATGNVIADMNSNGMAFTRTKSFSVRDTNALAGVFDVSMDNVLIESTGKAIIKASDTLTNQGKNIKHITGNNYVIKDFNNTFLRIDTIGGFEVGLSESYIKLKPEDSTMTLGTKDPMVWRQETYAISSQIKTGHGVDAIDIRSADYTILVPGVYVVSDNDNTHDVQIPAASKFLGQTIYIINTSGDKFGIYDNTTDIKDANAANVTEIQANTFNILVCNGTNWYKTTNTP